MRWEKRRRLRVPPFFFACCARPFPPIFKLPSLSADATFPRMGRKALAALALLGWSSSGHAVAPLHDPVVLNLGINCQWKLTCERRQRKAMADAHRFIARSHPPVWRIQMCNRNARRGPSRIDWVGFDNCIRNPRLSAPAPRQR